jgi:hypothetical protein
MMSGHLGEIILGCPIMEPIPDEEAPWLSFTWNDYYAGSMMSKGLHVN